MTEISNALLWWRLKFIESIFARKEREHTYIFLYVCAKVFSRKSDPTPVPIIVHHSRAVSGRFVDVRVRCLLLLACICFRAVHIM